MMKWNAFQRTWAIDHWLWRPFSKLHSSRQPCDCQNRSEPQRKPQHLWALPEWFSVWRPFDLLPWWFPVLRVAHQNCSIWYWDLCKGTEKIYLYRMRRQNVERTNPQTILTWGREVLAIDCWPTDCSNHVGLNASADDLFAGRVSSVNPSYSLRLQWENQILIHTIDWAHSSDSSGQFRMFICWFIFLSPNRSTRLIVYLLYLLLFILILRFHSIALHSQNNRNSSSIFTTQQEQEQQQQQRANST